MGRLGLTRVPAEEQLKYGVRLATHGNECLFDAQTDFLPNPTFFPHFVKPHSFISQITAVLTDLDMLGVMRIEWGPGAATHKPNGEIFLDLDCIVVPKCIWSSWLPPQQCTSRAENYLRRLVIPGSQPFTQNQQDWNRKSELAACRTSDSPLQVVKSMWHILPPLAVRGPIQGVATSPTSIFLWEGYLRGPLRAHPLVKVR